MSCVNRKAGLTLCIHLGVHGFHPNEPLSANLEKLRNAVRLKPQPPIARTWPHDGLMSALQQSIVRFVSKRPVLVFSSRPPIIILLEGQEAAA